VIPAIKWQTSPVPGKIDLSTTFGAGLPTGSKAIAGPGLQPYLQFPWSWELGGGWGISGMLTNFIVPADPTNKLSTETTFVLEREFAEHAFLFVEYVGYYHIHGGPSYLFNSGGGYRITATQQIDLHIGIGLDDRAPAYIVGIGYIPARRPVLTGWRLEQTLPVVTEQRDLQRDLVPHEWLARIGATEQHFRAQSLQDAALFARGRPPRARASLALRNHFS
jgi:hypothetical protein